MNAHIGMIHKVVVALFLLHYVIKTVLLLAGKKEGLTKYAAKTKILEMIISTLFLVSGVYLMIILEGEVSSMIWIKIVVVMASIPLAVIGFKREKKPLALLSLVLLIVAYGLGEMAKAAKTKRKDVNMTGTESPMELGKKLYLEGFECTTCHGADGKKGLAGATDLTTSATVKEDVKNIIKDGKGQMQAYGGKLKPGELDALTEYVMSLRK